MLVVATTHYVQQAAREHHGKPGEGRTAQWAGPAALHQMLPTASLRFTLCPCTLHCCQDFVAVERLALSGAAAEEVRYALQEMSRVLADDKVRAACAV
jgi:hypothetical protein